MHVQARIGIGNSSEQNLSSVRILVLHMKRLWILFGEHSSLRLTFYSLHYHRGRGEFYHRKVWSWRWSCREIEQILRSICRMDVYKTIERFHEIIVRGTNTQLYFYAVHNGWYRPKNVHRACKQTFHAAYHRLVLRGLNFGFLSA